MQKNISAHGRKVPFRHWLYIVGVMILALVLSEAYARKSQGETFGFDRAFVIEEVTPVRGDLGFITAGTNLCHTDGIAPHIIKRLATWIAIVEKADAAGGAIFLSAEDNELGKNLRKMCSTLAAGYPVMIFSIEGEHALVFWDKSLNFGGSPFIIRLSDFQAGGLRL